MNFSLVYRVGVIGRLLAGGVLGAETICMDQLVFPLDQTQQN